MYLLQAIFEMEQACKKKQKQKQKQKQQQQQQSATYHLPFLEKRMRVLKETVVVLSHNIGTIYLIGTLHNREESAAAVQKLIGMVQPHIVAVELCLTTLEGFNLGAYVRPRCSRNDVNRSSDLAIMPPRLKNRAIGEKLLLSLISESIKYSNRCTYENQMKRFAMVNPYTRRFAVKPKVYYHVVIGKEMTTPFGTLSWQLIDPDLPYLTCARAPYKIMLADKPIEETFCEISSALSDDEKKIIQVYQSNFLRLFISMGSKSKSLIRTLMERNKKLSNAIVKHRDSYMAHSLCMALRDASENTDATHKEAATVVAVVGRNHIDGILEYISPIMSKLRSKYYKIADDNNKINKINKKKNRKIKSSVQALDAR